MSTTSTPTGVVGGAVCSHEVTRGSDLMGQMSSATAVVMWQFTAKLLPQWPGKMLPFKDYPSGKYVIMHC